jgi:ribose transport system ATP-binding protein
VLLVTHRLDEVRAICDRMTILRDGALVHTGDVAGLAEDDLVELVLGRPLEALYPPPHSVGGELAMRVHGLAGSGVAPLDLSLRRGEVVGLTGLVGMGQERVPALLFGAERATAGVLEVGGASHDLTAMTPARAMRVGIALLPANRLRLGGVGAATLTENLTLPTLRRHRRGGRLRRRDEREAARAMLERFAVVPLELDRPLATLSGGNQQKLLLAKWFALEPTAMLLHEPTQGVDVGAKSQIFSHVRDAAEAGTAFLVISSEYEDLAHLCDRVLVFRDGTVVSELSGAALTEERIVECCFREPTETTVG